MKHYYITDPSAEKGFVEVSEEEFRAVVGDETTRPYANKVYRGEITIEEVPEELREAVQAVVEEKNPQIRPVQRTGNKSMGSAEHPDRR